MSHSSRGFIAWNCFKGCWINSPHIQSYPRVLQGGCILEILWPFHSIDIYNFPHFQHPKSSLQVSAGQHLLGMSENHMMDKWVCPPTWKKNLKWGLNKWISSISSFLSTLLLQLSSYVSYHSQMYLRNTCTLLFWLFCLYKHLIQTIWTKLTQDFWNDKRPFIYL